MRIVQGCEYSNAGMECSKGRGISSDGDSIYREQGQMGKETRMGIIVKDIVHQRWNSDTESIEYSINDATELR